MYTIEVSLDELKVIMELRARELIGTMGGDNPDMDRVLGLIESIKSAALAGK